MTKLSEKKKAVTIKRQQSKLPLLRAQKKKKSTKKYSIKIWFGIHHRLEIRLSRVAKKRSTKAIPRPSKRKAFAHNYRSILVFGLSGMYLFSPTFLSSANPPAVPVYSAPAPAVFQKQQQANGLTASKPLSLQIESVGIQTTIGDVDLNTDGTLEVPKSFESVGWYRRSPTPGQIGPSIITGHVDSYKGPAVFWKLSQVKAGDKILVTREDDSVVTFIVDYIEQFNQDNFPTDTVYGNISTSGLRLITCGGYYERSAQRYTHNTVVFASIEPVVEKPQYIPTEVKIINPIFES